MEEQIQDLGQKDALFYPLGILLMEIRSIIMLMNQKRNQEQHQQPRVRHSNHKPATENAAEVSLFHTMLLAG